MLHAGIDMHKEFLMVTVLDEEGSEVVSGRRIPASGLSIEEFFGEYEPEEITTVLEAGPNWYSAGWASARAWRSPASTATPWTPAWR